MMTVTANRLTDGRVIYRTPEGQWTTELDEAARLEGERANIVLGLAEAEGDLAVGPYLIELEEAEAALRPGGQKHRRELIRLTGPTAGSTKLLAHA